MICPFCRAVRGPAAPRGVNEMLELSQVDAGANEIFWRTMAGRRVVCQPSGKTVALCQQYASGEVHSQEQREATVAAEARAQLGRGGRGGTA